MLAMMGVQGQSDGPQFVVPNSEDTDNTVYVMSEEETMLDED
jgi:hypothetical protein